MWRALLGVAMLCLGASCWILAGTPDFEDGTSGQSAGGQSAGGQGQGGAPAQSVSSASATSTGSSPASGGSGGTGGAGGGAAGAGGSPLPTKYVFLSAATPVPGLDFVGVAGADTECTNEGIGTLGGTYVAWLSEGNVAAIDRVPDARYIRPGGAEVFASKSVIPMGPQVPINRHADNTAIASLQATVWTGTTPMGTNSGNHCSGWTSDVSSLNGTVGLATSADPVEWTQQGIATCATMTAHFYCFQQ